MSLSCVCVSAYACACEDFTFLITRYESHQEEVSIALVGKYTKYEDTYTSVVKALKHASLQCRRKLKLMVNKLYVTKICLYLKFRMSTMGNF